MVNKIKHYGLLHSSLQRYQVISRWRGGWAMLSDPRSEIWWYGWWQLICSLLIQTFINMSIQKCSLKPSNWTLKLRWIRSARVQRCDGQSLRGGGAALADLWRGGRWRKITFLSIQFNFYLSVLNKYSCNSTRANFVVPFANKRPIMSKMLASRIDPLRFQESWRL